VSAAAADRRAPPPRLLLLSAAPDSAGHVYRVEHAVSGLRTRGWDVRWLPLSDAAAAAAVASADVVTVFRGRWDDGFEAIHAATAARGVPLVIDLDDLVFDESVALAGGLALLDHFPVEARDRWLADTARCRAALAAADAAVATTEPLAAAVAAVCPRVHIVPNTVGVGMIAAAETARREPKPSRQDGLVRLGFASGTPTHHRDFATIAPALARLLARRPETRLVVVGSLDVAAVPELRPLAARIEVRPRVPLGALEGEVARFDVNLAPLEGGNPFCECKSAIRVTTASLVAVPSVVAPTGVLAAAVRHGESGWVARHPGEWDEWLETLVADPRRRVAMGEEACRDVLARFGPRAAADALASAYGAILAAGRR